MGAARKTITVYELKGGWIRRKLKSDLTTSWTAPDTLDISSLCLDCQTAERARPPPLKVAPLCHPYARGISPLFRRHKNTPQTVTCAAFEAETGPT